MPVVDLAETPVRQLNAMLHGLPENTNETRWEILNSEGRHALAVGLDAPVTVEIAAMPAIIAEA